VILDFKTFQDSPSTYILHHSNSQRKRDQDRMYIYNYKQINLLQWEKFTSCTSALKLSFPNIGKCSSYNAYDWQSKIDLFWFNIRDAIIESKHRHLPKTKLNRHNHERTQPLPLFLRQFTNDISKVQKILLKFGSNRIDYHMTLSDKPRFAKWIHYWTDWQTHHTLLFQIRTKYKVLDNFPLPHPITEDNFTVTKTLLKNF
jgi:hypothetical protein